MKALFLTAAVGLSVVACTGDKSYERGTDPVATDARRTPASRPAVDTSNRTPARVPDRATDRARADMAPPPAAAVAEPVDIVVVEPSTPTVAADNSERNEVDRDPATLTAGDQSNARSDIQITAAIRRGVVGRSGMSTYGKNVKIITQAGHVTLRGPVETDEERAFIKDMARKTAGVTEVSDYLSITSH